jgi:hypothetical protein
VLSLELSDYSQAKSRAPRSFVSNSQNRLRAKED